MDSRSWKIAKQLFTEAITVPRERREQWLATECPDEEIQLELRELLAAHDEADDGGAPGPAVSVAEGPGVTIDRYKLLQEIGEGGFGTVYMALQSEPVERRVALKIIKPGMDTGQIVARFEAERQAIALMEHPNIARVLDAGATSTGKPYFVMELVKGIPITEYCQQHGLSPRERLGLFIQVCQGVQHAHQKGIIHRDLKPSNVLVAEYDNVPVPKIIDFGVAKATSHRLTQKTVFTEFGQLVGTIEYMSPEQAKLNQIDVDTRSDVYSLGVLLYELLTGTTPFTRQELASQAFDEVLRIIREEEPPKPSTRVTTQVSANVSGDRDPQKLSRMLRGDLDWIVMRSLDKERNRRYGSAGGLAEDVERFLSGEPVQARPQSTSYRLRKFVRRHRGAVAAASLLLLTLVLGLAGTSYGLKLAVDSEREAVDARESQRRLTGRMAMERGLDLCEAGNVGPGMLWLSRALAMATTGDEATRRVIRANLNGWRARLHKLELVIPHEAPVICVRYHPGGELLVTGTTAGLAHIWNANTGAPVCDPLPHGSDVHSLAFGGDGAWVLSTTLRTEARFWDARTGKPMGQLLADDSGTPMEGFQDAVVGARGGRQLVTGHRGGEIRVWDVETKTRVAELEKQTHAVHSLGISADGRFLLTACHDGNACVWDIGSKSVVARFRHGPQARVAAATFVGADDRRVVTGGSDGTVLLWSIAAAEAREDRTLDARDGEVEAVLARHTGAVHRMQLSADRQQVLTASFDNTVRVFDFRGDAVRETVLDHPSSVQDATFHPDGTRIATASDDKLVRIWRLARFSDASQPADRPGTQQAVFSADGRYVMTISESNVARVRETGSETLLAELPHEPGVRAMAVSADRSACVTGDAKGRLRIWDVEASRFRCDVDTLGGGIWSVAIHPDGVHVAVGGFDGSLRIFDARTGEAVGLPRLIGRRVHSVAFDPAGSLLALGCDDQSAHLLDPHVPQPGRKLNGHRSTVTVVAFSRDGSRLVTGSYDRTVRVWDVASGRPISRPMRQSGIVFYVALAFSSDGRLVAVGCEDGTARVWDIESASPIGPILRHDSAVCMTSFGGHGTVLTGSARGTVRSWEVPTEPLVGSIERIRLWVETATGVELKEDGTLAALDGEAWSARRAELERLGGPPR